MQDFHAATKAFSTQQYGPLYIVRGSHARGATFFIYLLDEDQRLDPAIQRRIGPNNKPSVLRDDQAVFGVVGGQPGWDEEYGWLNTHSNVVNGRVQGMFEQLMQAHQTAIELGITNASERAVWLDRWAQENLGRNTPTLALPELDV